MPDNTDDPSDDGVLAPEELELDDEHVTTLDEHRYVIEPDGASPMSTKPTPDDEPTPSTDDTRTAASSLREHSARHGVVITAKTDGAVDGARLASDDIREVFDGLLEWYATQLDADLPPEDVLAIMLEASSLTEQ